MGIVREIRLMAENERLRLDLANLIIERDALRVSLDAMTAERDKWKNYRLAEQQEKIDNLRSDLATAIAAAQWQPVPQSLEYDLVTHAIHNGEIPAGYRICHQVPAAPDPLAHLIPPLDQWPDNAVAWMFDTEGFGLYLVTNFWGGWDILPSTDEDVPAGLEWMESLRLRPPKETP